MSAATVTTSSRDRLAQACALLRRYGVCATGPMAGDPAEIRRRLGAALRDRFPHGACSYVFWTADTAFDAAGSLVRPLVLHYNGAAVGGAVQAALAERQLLAAEGPEPFTLVVEPRPDPGTAPGQG